MRYEDGMTIEELRKRIDVLDRQLVELLSERARAALTIGQLKAATSLPVYEPNREKVIYRNICAANKGPLPDSELTHIYERIIDVMRSIQRDELASERNAQGRRGGHEGHAAGAPSSQERQSVAGKSGTAPETGTKQ
jgi:chorismate mutase-like protein